MLLVLLAGILSGCASEEQIKARKAAIAAAEDAKCRSYGAQPGTEVYFQCRMTLNNIREQRQMVEDANRQAAGVQMMSIGASMMTGR